MFQYAFSKALEKHYERKVYLDKEFLLNRSFVPGKSFVFRDFDLDIFNINISFAKPGTEKKFKDQTFFNYIFSGCKKKIYLNEEHFYYMPDVFNLKNDTYFQGYWQSYRYFENVKEDLMKDFSLSVSPQSVELYNEIKNNNNSVCINVRRGDFLVNPFHGSHGLEYFGKAIDIICSKILNPVFYIFSDDIEWCRNNFNLNYSYQIVSYEHKGHKFGNYLKLISACHHFIIPNSSFAWWAIWLSHYKNKIVIAPKDWFADRKFNKETFDLIPNEWMRI